MIKNTKNNSNFNFIKNYLYIYVSIFLYSFFAVLWTVFRSSDSRIPQTIAFIIFLIISIKLLSNYINQKRKEMLFSFFLLWQFFIIIRVEFLNIKELRFFLFEPIHFLSYLIPLVVLMPISIINFKKISYSLLFFSLIFLFLNFFLILKFPINNFTDLIAMSSLPTAGILILLSKYSNKYIIATALLIVISVLLIGLMYGKRSVILGALLFLFFSFLTNVILNKKLSFFLKSSCLIFIAVISIYSVNSFLNSADKSKYAIFDRADTDSRSGVITAFTKDFQFNDFLIGRGIDGAYYNPMKYWSFDNEESREVTYRTNIENGFLYLIMKGGVIWLFLFLIILFRAMYLGFFKSKNLFSKALACYLFIYFIDMFVFGQPTFSIKYLLVWVCIALCTSIRFRSINENQLMRLINSKPNKKPITRELKG